MNPAYFYFPFFFVISSFDQSDDISSQLMHGVRYLDVRIGYYRATQPNFWVNHGITRQQPLHKVLQQVRDFVMDTDEIVIFDIQEFPVGFGKNLDIHRKLVQYIHSEIGELLVDPSGTWDVKLENIWQNRRNIILGYDYVAVVQEFPSIVFQSVQQRWGNVQRLDDLKRYLAPRSNIFQMQVFIDVRIGMCPLLIACFVSRTIDSRVGHKPIWPK